MKNSQPYSNKGFNRAAEVRETNTEPSNITFVPIYKEQFFINKETSNETILDIPSDLVPLSDKKYFLGIIEGKEVWCVDLSEVSFSIINNYLPHSSLQCVRDISDHIQEDIASLLAYAKGITNWNSTNQFCSNCGSKTRYKEKGHSRTCLNDSCETLHFPRINPAVIVLIEYKEKNRPALCLLNLIEIDSKQIGILFSGFTEIGESLEDTVVREMKEEINIDVNNIKYISSQPWPFPAALMLGFTAETNSKNFKIDNKEIKKAQWFSADEVNQLIHDKKLVIAKNDSISKYLIERWVKQNQSNKE